jgi:hypothetical protein
LYLLESERAQARSSLKPMESDIRRSIKLGEIDAMVRIALRPPTITRYTSYTFSDFHLSRGGWRAEAENWHE